MQGYVDIISKIEKLGNKQVAGFTFHGLLLSHRPMPIPIPAESDILITDSISFIEFLRNYNSDKTLAELLKVTGSKSTNNSHLDFTIFDESIKVKEWTILRKMHRH